VTAEAILDGTPYVAYQYAYPHKTAYRALAEPAPLGPLWARERRDALFLYLHVPFCEMRCGFCNLFTTVTRDEDLVAAYVAVIARQARRVRAALDAGGRFAFARVAIGGGTPTLLEPAALAALLDVAEETMGADLAALPVSIETSPETATAERLALVGARGIDRVSIGVQSFFEDEARAVHRPQRTADVEAALDRIRAVARPRTLNIDLMYGLPGQTPARWEASLARALTWAPEELYLYPLYVRPMTTLGKRDRAWDDERLARYRQGRDYLLAHGYAQVSMRMFRRVDAGAAADAAPVYCCQADGMVGLGCGARSYTESLHYASEYAVGARGVQGILADYVRRPDADFDVAGYGIRLDTDERRRRHVLLSLLSDEGLDEAGYAARFGAAPATHLPELATLAPHGLAEATGDGRLRLTAAGVERSDAIGPWLGSPRVRALMQAYELR
jgi:oxygen-independent coproporphyrinogen-3 oxidase